MARIELEGSYRRNRGSFTILVLATVAAFAFIVGVMVSLWTTTVNAKTKNNNQPPRVVYPKRTELDYSGLNLEGELKNPAELYFQVRPQEKFDSLVKRRKNFHREMLRDVVMSK